MCKQAGASRETLTSVCLLSGIRVSEKISLIQFSVRICYREMFTLFATILCSLVQITLLKAAFCCVVHLFFFFFFLYRQ